MRKKTQMVGERELCDGLERVKIARGRRTRTKDTKQKKNDRDRKNALLTKWLPAQLGSIHGNLLHMEREEYR